MTAPDPSLRPAGRSGVTSPTAEIARLVLDTAPMWQRRAVKRARLAELDERLFRDFGLNRLEFLLEVERPTRRG